jgi:hypothetical protein
MMHALSLGTVLWNSSPPLFMQCRGGCNENLTGRRSTSEFGQIMMHTLFHGAVLLSSSPPPFVQCRSGFSANMTGRRSTRARLA